MTSAKEVCEFFYAIEAEYKLLEWQVRGLYIWPILRMVIYYKITEKTGLYQDNIMDKKGMKNRLAGIAGIFLRGVFCNPFLSPQDYRYALYVHARKVEGRDIYSDQVMQEMGKNGLILDSSYNSPKMPQAFDMAVFTLLAVLYSKVRMQMNPKASPADEDLINRVNTRIQERFGVTIPLRRYFWDKLFLCSFLKPVYKALFRYKKVQHLFIVNAYSHPYITAAAQELGIKISELQHGLITPYHLGYSYPGQAHVPYVADEFLCFGTYWTQSANLPASTKTRVIGAPHLSYIMRKNKTEKTPRSIFFSSQTVIGREVFDYALQTARLLPDHTITLNLHPSDTPNRYILPPGTPSNFTMLYRPSGFFDLLARHEYQAGSFSTTLFEGMALGNKIILLNLPGAENMEPVLTRGDGIFVRGVEELVEKLEQAKQAENTEDYYAPPVKRVLES